MKCFKTGRQGVRECGSLKLSKRKCYLKTLGVNSSKLDLWRSTSMVTDFGSPEVDKNGNISVYRLLFFLMMVPIDRSRCALSIDILIAKTKCIDIDIEQNMARGRD